MKNIALFINGFGDIKKNQMLCEGQLLLVNMRDDIVSLFLKKKIIGDSPVYGEI